MSIQGNQPTYHQAVKLQAQTANGRGIQARAQVDIAANDPDLVSDELSLFSKKKGAFQKAVGDVRPHASLQLSPDTLAGLYGTPTDVAADLRGQIAEFEAAVGADSTVGEVQEKVVAPRNTIKGNAFKPTTRAGDPEKFAQDLDFETLDLLPTLVASDTSTEGTLVQKRNEHIAQYTTLRDKFNGTGEGSLKRASQGVRTRVEALRSEQKEMKRNLVEGTYGFKGDVSSLSRFFDKDVAGLNKLEQLKLTANTDFAKYEADLKEIVATANESLKSALKADTAANHVRLQLFLSYAEDLKGLTIAKRNELLEKLADALELNEALEQFAGDNYNSGSSIQDKYILAKNIASGHKGNLPELKGEAKGAIDFTVKGLKKLYAQKGYIRNGKINPRTAQNLGRVLDSSIQKFSTQKPEILAQFEAKEVKISTPEGEADLRLPTAQFAESKVADFQVLFDSYAAAKGAFQAQLGDAEGELVAALEELGGTAVYEIGDKGKQLDYFESLQRLRAVAKLRADEVQTNINDIVEQLPELAEYAALNNGTFRSQEAAEAAVTFRVVSALKPQKDELLGKIEGLKQVKVEAAQLLSQARVELREAKSRVTIPEKVEGIADANHAVLEAKEKLDNSLIVRDSVASVIKQLELKQAQLERTFRNPTKATTEAETRELQAQLTSVRNGLVEAKQRLTEKTLQLVQAQGAHHVAQASFVALSHAAQVTANSTLVVDNTEVTRAEAKVAKQQEFFRKVSNGLKVKIGELQNLEKHTQDLVAQMTPVYTAHHELVATTNALNQAIKDGAIKDADIDAFRANLAELEADLAGVSPALAQSFRLETGQAKVELVSALIVKIGEDVSAAEVEKAQLATLKDRHIRNLEADAASQAATNAALVELNAQKKRIVAGANKIFAKLTTEFAQETGAINAEYAAIDADRTKAHGDAIVEINAGHATEQAQLKAAYDAEVEKLEAEYAKKLADIEASTGPAARDLDHDVKRTHIERIAADRHNELEKEQANAKIRLGVEFAQRKAALVKSPVQATVAQLEEEFEAAVAPIREANVTIQAAIGQTQDQLDAVNSDLEAEGLEFDAKSKLRDQKRSLEQEHQKFSQILGKNQDAIDDLTGEHLDKVLAIGTEVSTPLNEAEKAQLGLIESQEAEDLKAIEDHFAPLLAQNQKEYKDQSVANNKKHEEATYRYAHDKLDVAEAHAKALKDLRGRYNEQRLASDYQKQVAIESQEADNLVREDALNKYYTEERAGIRNEFGAKFASIKGNLDKDLTANQARADLITAGRADAKENFEIDRENITLTSVNSQARLGALTGRISHLDAQLRVAEDVLDPASNRAGFERAHLQLSGNPSVKSSGLFLDTERLAYAGDSKIEAYRNRAALDRAGQAYARKLEEDDFSLSATHSLEELQEARLVDGDLGVVYLSPTGEAADEVRAAIKGAIDEGALTDLSEDGQVPTGKLVPAILGNAATLTSIGAKNFARLVDEAVSQHIIRDAELRAAIPELEKDLGDSPQERLVGAQVKLGILSSEIDELRINEARLVQVEARIADKDLADSALDDLYLSGYDSDSTEFESIDSLGDLEDALEEQEALKDTRTNLQAAEKEFQLTSSYVELLQGEIENPGALEARYKAGTEQILKLLNVPLSDDQVDEMALGSVSVSYSTSLSNSRSGSISSSSSEEQGGRVTVTGQPRGQGVRSRTPSPETTSTAGEAAARAAAYAAAAQKEAEYSQDWFGK